MALMKCPKCQKPFDPEKSDAMPFCSKRCRLADLNGWFREEFSIPLDIEAELERRATEAMSDESLPSEVLPNEASLDELDGRELGANAERTGDERTGDGEAPPPHLRRVSQPEESARRK